MPRSFRCFLCPGQPITPVPDNKEPYLAAHEHYMAHHYEGE